jgi:hypothetical protein
MTGVERRRLLPPWLVHGFQVGAVAALLAGGTLLAFQLGRPAPRTALPQGLDGSLILVPALLALGVLAISLPMFLAATRSEAIFGSVTGFLVAADLLMAVSFVARQLIAVHPLSRSLPLGVVAAVLSIPVALAGIAVGQLASEHGFGHTAGMRAVLGSAALAVLIALAWPFLG